MAGSTTYTNPDPSFSIVYPSGWTTDTDIGTQTNISGALVAFLAPREGFSDDFSENINVLVEHIPEGTTLRDFAAASIANAPNLITGFHVIAHKPATLGGHPADALEYTGTSNGRALHWFAESIVVGSMAYVITYTAEPESYARYLPHAKATIDSFRLT